MITTTYAISVKTSAIMDVTLLKITISNSAYEKWTLAQLEWHNLTICTPTYSLYFGVNLKFIVNINKH